MREEDSRMGTPSTKEGEFKTIRTCVSASSSPLLFWVTFSGRPIYDDMHTQDVSVIPEEEQLFPPSPTPSYSKSSSNQFACI